MGAALSRLGQVLLSWVGGVGRQAPWMIGTAAGRFTGGVINGIVRGSLGSITKGLRPHLSKPNVQALINGAKQRFKINTPNSLNGLKDAMSKYPEFSVFVLMTLPALGVEVADWLTDDGTPEGRDFIEQVNQQQEFYKDQEPFSVVDVADLFKFLDDKEDLRDLADGNTLRVGGAVSSAFDRIVKEANVSSSNAPTRRLNPGSYQGRLDNGHIPVSKRHNSAPSFLSQNDNIVDSFIERGASASENLRVDMSDAGQRLAVISILRFAKQFFHGETGAIQAHKFIQAFFEMPTEDVEAGFRDLKV